MWFTNISPQSVSYLFILFTRGYEANLKNFSMKSGIIPFPFLDLAFVSSLITLCLDLPCFRRFLKVIFSISFIVLRLYLESILSRDLRFRLRFFFFCSGFLIASFVKICLFFPLNCFCSVVKNKLEIFDWIYFWFLYSIPLIFVSISLQISHCLYYCSYLIGFNVRWNYSSYFIF